jgi:hypothetical protein
MRRIEIFVNQSIESDLFDAFSRRGVAKNYTKIPNTHGQGHTDPKMGDHIWPEENIVFIIYCKKEEAQAIEGAIREVKEQFPHEGLQFFSIEF